MLRRCVVVVDWCCAEVVWCVVVEWYCVVAVWCVVVDWCCVKTLWYDVVEWCCVVVCYRFLLLRYFIVFITLLCTDCAIVFSWCYVR